MCYFSVTAVIKTNTGQRTAIFGSNCTAVLEILSTCANITGLNVRKCVIFQLQLSSKLILANEQLFLEVNVQLYSNIDILGLHNSKFTFLNHSYNFSNPSMLKV